MSIENMKIEITDDDVLVLTVDLKTIIGESQTGRSEIIASSQGNLRLPDGKGSFRDEILNFSVSRRKLGTKPHRWLI